MKGGGRAVGGGLRRDEERVLEMEVPEGED
jgi:hypothetical protein